MVRNIRISHLYFIAMKRYFLYWFLLLSAVLFANCQATLTKMVGIKHINSYSEAELSNISKQYGVNGPVYSLDTGYIGYANSFHDSVVRKNMMQPLQIIFFKDQKVQSHLINCIVGGFPNLKWNRYHTFDSLPFVSSPVLEPHLQLDSIISHVQPKPEIAVNKNICIVFWNNWMGRQSKNLIGYSKDPKVTANYDVLYINNDNLYEYLEDAK